MKQKRKLGRRVLSFLLTLAMLVGLMPGMGMTTEAATIQYDDYLVEVTNHNQNFIDAGICDQTTGLKCKPLSVETAKALENYLKSKTGSKVAVIYGCTVRSEHPGWSRISFVIDGTTAENYYMDALIARAISNRGARNEAEYKLFYVNTDAPDFETANETVTFKVINGQWDDGTTEDVTVSLSGLKDEIRLAADQIPAVGTKPNDTYKAGSWDVTPSADTAITAATTYTYTYAQKESISQTVTFKVVNGSWNDETTTDKSVPLTGYEGDTLKLAATDIPAVGTKPNDTYKAGSWDVTPSADTAITAATTYTYTYAQKDSISQTVTFKVVNGSWNDETTTDKTVTLTGYEGDTLKLAATDIPAVGTKPNDTYKSGSWDVIPNTDTAITEATTYTYTYVAKEASVVTKAPEAKTLTYNGQAQELVTAGTATGGEMQYALGNATEATGPYTISIPTETDAGTYYVWYKVIGDENHADSETKCVTVTIGRRSSGGGSSGGSSSSPSTPTTPTESYTIPVSGENTVNVTASISNETAVVSDISKSEIDKIIDAGNSTGTNENISVTIDLSQAKSEVTSVQLTKETVEKLTEAVNAHDNLESVEIKMSKATVELDGKALSAVSEQAEGSSIKLVVKDTQTTKLNASQQESLKQFTSAQPFQAYFESKGKEIHDFKGGKATVSIKFSPETGKDVKYYHMYYLPLAGAIERYETRYIDGMLNFVTGHFSDYAIVYDETRENETGKEDEADNTDTDDKFETK